MASWVARAVARQQGQRWSDVSSVVPGRIGLPSLLHTVASGYSSYVSLDARLSSVNLTGDLCGRAHRFVADMGRARGAVRGIRFPIPHALWHRAPSAAPWKNRDHNYSCRRSRCRHAYPSYLENASSSSMADRLSLVQTNLRYSQLAAMFALGRPAGRAYEGTQVDKCWPTALPTAKTAESDIRCRW